MVIIRKKIIMLLEIRKYINIKVLIHVLFWGADVVVSTLQVGLYTNQYKEQFLVETLHLPVIVTSTYFMIYFLIPRFLLKKEYRKFFFFTVIFLLIVGLLDRANSYYIIRPIVFPGEPRLLGSFGVKYFSAIFNNFYIIAFASSLILFMHWARNQKIKQELMQEKMSAEMKYLKAQIHPHFLFNTLNNLYVLIKKKSDNAPDLLMKLSGLLRYMLYECNADTAQLEKEVEMIKGYLELEKIRYGAQLKVNFETTGDFSNITVPPVLLLPFIENSFKHGISRSIKELFVDIKLKAENDMVYFYIINSKDEDIENDKPAYTEGIGIKNVKRRMELIYGNGFSLKIENKQNTFEVELTINKLSSGKI